MMFFFNGCLCRFSKNFYAFDVRLSTNNSVLLRRPLLRLTSWWVELMPIIVIYIMEQFLYWITINEFNSVERYIEVRSEVFYYL